MTRIWSERDGFADSDRFVIETEERKAGDGETAVLGLEDFIAHASESNEANLAVVLKPADDVRALEPYLDRIAFVAVTFPAFSDGRGFSQAALLRDRLGYKGELRAVGDVLLDQIPHMLRTGFSSLAVTNPVAIARLEAGTLPGIAEHYQPSVKHEAAGAGYSWRRKG
ncbi:DUF934 domain-containing protein [Rhizobiaceae bacterium BDR2-2]|uniref:DUF934 domain-containing protein n=1 Tax=Ectorhizobium quercum TaxID=2965071 RepID=A0AAE3SV39_9HYPH|nr:DUF934 domain-containing protein [Ectorhizobium quercum]MCX8997747.1 DUF934 domain-containing protein [Ectorhizobium quercum]